MLMFFFLRVRWRGLGVETCSLKAALPFATVRNCPQLSATACNVRNEADMAILKALKREAYHFLWQALHLDYNILRSCVENSSLRPILAHLRL